MEKRTFVTKAQIEEIVIVLIVDGIPVDIGEVHLHSCSKPILEVVLILCEEVAVVVIIEFFCSLVEGCPFIEHISIANSPFVSGKVLCPGPEGCGKDQNQNAKSFLHVFLLFLKIQIYKTPGN